MRGWSCYHPRFLCTLEPDISPPILFANSQSTAPVADKWSFQQLGALAVFSLLASGFTYDLMLLDFFRYGSGIRSDSTGDALECHAHVQSVLDFFAVLFGQVAPAFSSVCHGTDLPSFSQGKVYHIFSHPNFHPNFHCGRHSENLLVL